MKIDALIHRDIISICVTEELNHVKRLLKKSSYLLVLNQKMTPIGIVTMHDLDEHLNVELKDLDLDKPGVKIQVLGKYLRL